MKKNNIILSFIIACLFILQACEEDLPTMADYKDYSFASVDSDAGPWTPILLSSPDNIVIADPQPTSSAAYQSELEALKQVRSSLSESQKKAIAYWTNNPTLRWNEIALELIAKYNLIPGPNEDGSYTLPNPNNPDGPPPFPFAHPPYAVRALAYMSVAQYDGLIAAWHYKYQFNRAEPAEVDPSISPDYVSNNIPSYPSDGAVVAQASKEVLKAMFPLEADYLEEMANQHLNSLMWAGVNVQSDIDAGKIIGQEVASIALSRAANDNMSKAQPNKAVSDSIKASAYERFGWQWENLESPVRPVGLTPLYSQVDMWYVPTLEEVRPIAPPEMDSPELAADIKKLIDIADNVTEEQRAIANYWQDGLGTYTPPGHWNKIAIDHLIAYGQNPIRCARTLAYLNIAMMDAGISCWDAKYYYHYPRPIQLIPNFKTIAGTPNFPSYTSGHSVFSAAGAEVLSYVFPQEAQKFREWALEAAVSRVYGGIHWTFDAEVGTTQGIQVASYTIQAAQNDGAN